MQQQLSLLAPQPQMILESSGELSLSEPCSIRLRTNDPSALFSAQRLKQSLANVGIGALIGVGQVAPDSDIVLALDRALCPQPESYKLVIEPSGVFIAAGDGAGLFYAVCTFTQLIGLYAGDADTLELPMLQISDWPDYPNRGLMLDISRDRVPTMDTLYSLIDLLASLKVNQLQLYSEHTFAYSGHEVVWQDASPITPEEALLLDAFCTERHIELVPNQNSFGHMHRWLKHDKYRPLAELPEGFVHGTAPSGEPYSLCPIDPGSIELLADMYGQLLPNFTSKQFNVGLDETFDLGMGRSKEACAVKGVGGVYMDFLKAVHALVTRDGHTMQFWSDIIVRDEPELVAELPLDVIALEWGYEADYAFGEHAGLIAESGRSFYVCPGTSTWNTLAGRTTNALGNLRSAAVSGYAHGAIGYLNTDWGDNGHMQPLPVSFLGILAGAAMSWNVESADTEHEPNWAGMLDAHVFQDTAGVMGEIAYDLGLAYLHAGTGVHNSSPLFWLLIFPEAMPEGRVPADTTADMLREAEEYITSVADRLESTHMQREDAELIVAEYRWVADMLRWAARLGVARLKVGMDQPVETIDDSVRRVLAGELRPLIERHRELWLLRSRPGGLDNSAGRLERMLAHLE